MNLGFLSTSRSKDRAERFIENLFITVRILNKERDIKLDHGYADISFWSKYSNEQEVIFNPCNTFIIENFE